MKRSAAILGPTPPFLRWTIVVPCPFRDADAKNLTDAAFRELRSLRAVAVGELERRIVDGVCLHPDADSNRPGEALGFPVEEVYAAYGGKKEADAACLRCPANVPVASSELDGEVEFSKAGCFGWLPFGNDDGASGFMALMECEGSGRETQGLSIVDQFEAAFLSQEDSGLFPTTSPRWFGVWSQGKFTKQQLVWLDRVCQQIDSASIAWQRLARAVRVSIEHDLEFRVDLTPAGSSDGVCWHVESCCSCCGASDPEALCKVCGTKAAPLRARKTRVLGLRPYLKLVAIFGAEETKRLCEK
ncbi:hypothetical protein [Mariniblastus fucicola]|uniref:Uncharacterized protein n=1 Tax=Mariniblastus fucicola TaxID=980251 RepID=A0A5B9PAK3_9BACT|nr:hypothetical protein [Mariniblastus fucicola]QEG21526.1 hypothetical protein MFFC18_13820 [Mariniblastus fucicola]